MFGFTTQITIGSQADKRWSGKKQFIQIKDNN